LRSLGFCATLLDEMSIPQRIFVGIDLTAPRRAYTSVALDGERRLLARNQGGLRDTLGYLAGLDSCVVVLNAPLQPGGAEVSDFLAARGIELAGAAVNDAAPPAWMRRSFGLANKLGEMGFRTRSGEDAARILLETNSEAGFWSLLGHIPYEARSFEGRVQRQLILHQAGLRLPNPVDLFEDITPRRVLQNLLPMDQIFAAVELSAGMAALAGWLAYQRPQEVLCPDESSAFVLPVRPA